VSIRAFNVAGAVDQHGDPDLTRITPKAVAAASGRFDEVTVNGDGNAIRDYVHVADLANAISLALAAAQAGQFHVYNVGATPATIAEIIDVARAVTGAANGPGPGRELDETQAQEVLQRALDRGFRVSGSLALGSVDWHYDKLNRSFSLTEVSDTGSAARWSGWGPP
jgi:nucleoside-diphosphate-sugar epimerase